MFALIIPLFFGIAMAAENPAVTKALTTSLEGNVYSAKLEMGYHFNDKAPILASVDGTQLKPKELKPHLVSFQLPAKYNRASASLYICDDNNTFCEPRVVAIKGELTQAAATSVTDNEVRINSHGFIEDNLKAAETIAKKEKKLVLLDFSARWCPGCVRFETEAFDKKDFKNASARFVKVKIDVDKFENTAAKKKYGISAIPTLIVVNENLEEISRIVDFQPMPTVRTFLREASTNPQTFTELQSKAQSDNSSALLLGRRLYNANKFAEAAGLLSKVKPEPIELLDAKVRAAEPDDEKADKANFQKTIRAAIEKEPNSSRSIVWRTMLCESLPTGSERKQIATDGMKIADDLLADEKKLKASLAGEWVGEFHGYEKLLVALNRSYLAEAGELGEDAILAASKKAAEVGQASRIPITRTGPSMRLYLAHMAAKNYVEAEQLIRKLLARDSKNPELQRRALRVLVENKKYAEGVKIGSEALAHSYGKNEVWVVQQLAKAYAGNAQKLEAKALINSYLARKDIDWSALPKEQKDLSEQLTKL